MIIYKELLDKVSAQAKESHRLRMNYNFQQQSLDDNHGFLNTVALGTVVLIHNHPTKDETFVILRRKIRMTTHNDDGTVIESVILCPEEGFLGVDFPKNILHNLEALEPDSVIFKCKEGPFVPHEGEGVLRLQR